MTLRTREQWLQEKRDRRQAVVRLHESGLQAPAIAEELDLTVNAVRSILQYERRLARKDNPA